MASRTTKKPTKLVSEWRYKKDKKAIHMWIEQLRLRQNDIENELEELRSTVTYLTDEIGKCQQ